MVTRSLCFIAITVYIMQALRGNGTTPLCEVLPYKINYDNYFLLISIICTLFDNFPNSSVGFLRLAICWLPVRVLHWLLFISFVEYYKFIFEENISKKVIVIIF